MGKMDKHEQRIVNGINKLCNETLSNAGQLAVLEYRLQKSDLRELSQAKAQELIELLLPISRAAIIELTIFHKGRFAMKNGEGNTPSLKKQVEDLLTHDNQFTVIGIRKAHTREGNDTGRTQEFEFKNFTKGDIPQLEKEWNKMIVAIGRGIEPRYSLEIKHLHELPK
jgi:hypothetical protein